MAHPCIHCGGECYCSGSWDDVIVEHTPINCEGCGCEDMWEDEDMEEDLEDELYDIDSSNQL